MAFPGTRGRMKARAWLRALRPVTDADDELIVARLYEEYHDPLLAFLIRQTGGDRQWAEDIVQETMIRAWRSLDQLDTEAAGLMPWLVTVARRIVIDERRRRGARPQEAGEDLLDRLQTPDGMEDLLRGVVVSEALKALSPAHREVLTETVLRDRRASGIVAMEPKAWGTHVALDLGGIRGPLTCRLVAVTRAGQRHVVTEWALPPRGYGVAGSPDHLQVHGGTAVQRRDLGRFDVEVEGGGLLLSIPV